MNKLEWDYIEQPDDGSVTLFFHKGQRKLVAVMYEGKIFKCNECEDQV